MSRSSFSFTHRLEKTVWLSWENHRRTTELSKTLGVQLFTLLYHGSYLGKVFVLSLRTIVLLLRLLPHRVIGQNPSMVLSALLCFLKPLFGYRVIVDRHSNSTFECGDPQSRHFIGTHSVAHVCSFAADESVDEVLQAPCSLVVRSARDSSFGAQAGWPRRARFGGDLASNPGQSAENTTLLENPDVQEDNSADRNAA